MLSNNDGCAVARSQEAKDLGIKMGVPLFQIKDIVEQHQVQVLSSNYALYAEMSRRFMKILADFVSPKEQEIYSIDESFLDLTAHAGNYDLTEYAHQIRQRLFSWLGLPVCIGIAESRDVNNGDLFTIDGLSDKQLWRISRHKEFISTYSGLAKGDAGKNWTAYSDFIVGEIKKDPSKFSKKRPIREYLDGNEADYDFSR